MNWRCHGTRLTFPHIVEAEFLRPDSDHSPGVQQDDSNGYGVEHRFGGEAVAFLNVPEAEDTYGLGGDSDNQKVCEVEGVVSHDGVLEGSDHGHRCVERVSEEEVAWKISKPRCMIFESIREMSNSPIK